MRLTPGVRTLLLGAAALLASLLLHALHGLVLMGYDDSAGGEWSLAGERAWVASLPVEWQVAYWGTAVAAPLALLVGVALVAVGVRRSVAGRTAREPHSARKRAR